MPFELNVAESVAVGVGLGLVVCIVACIACRIWRRNRYYSKVQKTLDDEERAFQECAAAPGPCERPPWLPWP